MSTDLFSTEISFFIFQPISDQDDERYVRKILIPMGTIIAQGIMVKTERISIHEY